MTGWCVLGVQPRQSAHKGVRIPQLAPGPVPMHPFGNRERCTGPTERVDHKIAGLATDRQDPLQHLLAELIGATMLLATVPHWGDIGPHVAKVDAVRVELVPVATVVLDVSATVAANVDGEARAREPVFGLPFV